MSASAAMRECPRCDGASGLCGWCGKKSCARWPASLHEERGEWIVCGLCNGSGTVTEQEARLEQLVIEARAAADEATLLAQNITSVAPFNLHLALGPPDAR